MQKISDKCSLQYSYDFVKIGNDQNYTFGKYCGRRTGQTVVVYGNFALVTFHSDFIVNKRGFFFRFKTVLTGLYSCLLKIFNEVVRV